MSETPVTRQQLEAAEARTHDHVDQAEARGIDLIERVTDHFDQRLKDSERVLTWRMVAVGGMTGVLTSLLDVLARGDGSAVVQAAVAVGRQLS